MTEWEEKTIKENRNRRKAEKERELVGGERKREKVREEKEQKDRKGN